MISHIMGGLGNQMFCYACGYAMAKEKVQELKLDKNRYTASYDRSYGLDAFQLDYPEDAHVHVFPQSYFGKVCRELYYRLMYCVIKDNNIEQFMLRAAKDRKQPYLYGLFQDERYFLKYRNEIKRQFTLKSPSDDYKRFAHEVTPHSLSVHIRRGDYTKLGICMGIDYYIKGYAYIAEHSNIDLIYVFTDDVAWCKENIDFVHSTIYVKDAYHLSDAEEMLAMSCCTNHIISNSTYSWWGAWLGTKDGITIRPANWTITKCPVRWVTLE